ncbi:MAG: hypothetical protein ACFFE8_12210 [Candidatus Heimdallarchaeota archaeon]
MPSNEVANEIGDEEAFAPVDQLSSYIYGALVLMGLTLVMLIVHIALAFFFHELPT